MPPRAAQAATVILLYPMQKALISSAQS